MVLIYWNKTHSILVLCGYDQPILKRFKQQLFWVLIPTVILTMNSCGLFTYVPYWTAKKKAPYDAIIVPGFPYKEHRT
jgi:hypothetical protein